MSSALFLKAATTAFVAPHHALHRTTAASKVACHALPISTLLSAELTDIAPAGFDDAFTDELVFFDPTIRLLLTGFGVFVVLALIAKFLLGQMDGAIEKVLVEFEGTMRAKYASRWVSIEAKLEGLDEPERSQRLFQIMEKPEQDESDFMAQVNRDMAA